jgi:hypothetical protein
MAANLLPQAMILGCKAMNKPEIRAAIQNSVLAL